MPNRLFAYAFLTPLLGNAAIPAFAQTGAADAIEEIVVTAQKREESLQDTPVSIAAFSARDLEAKGISGLINARLALTDIPGLPGVRAALWGRNLADKEYYLMQFNIGRPGAIFGEPRTYGFDLSVEF